MKMTVFGCGYVGLVTGACFAELGHEVYCLDQNRERIQTLRVGRCPIFEADLETLIQQNLGRGRLHFGSDAEEGIAFAPVIVVAVGTPSDATGAADLQAVLQVIQSIATHLTESKLVIQKSTVPVGTAHRIQEMMDGIVHRRFESSMNTPQVYVVSSPEFLKEGSAVADCLRPDRIILGLKLDEKLADLGSWRQEQLRILFAPFIRTQTPILQMSRESAELSKYAANAFLATKITFMNEISRLSEHLGADMDDIRSGLGSDSRIGVDFLRAGLGYGGSCFPKDVRALIQQAQTLGQPAEILRAVHATNLGQRDRFEAQLVQALGGCLKERTIAIWGLAFKPQTDDVREAPSLDLIQRFLKRGARVQAYDPIAVNATRTALPSSAELQFGQSAAEVLEAADALCIMTEWPEFESLDLALVATRLRQPLIFDGRNLYSPQSIKKLAIAGLRYYSIGRPPVINQPDPDPPVRKRG